MLNSTFFAKTHNFIVAELSTDNHHYSLPVGSTVKHEGPNTAKFPAAYRAVGVLFQSLHTSVYYGYVTQNRNAK